MRQWSKSEYQSMKVGYKTCILDPFFKIENAAEVTRVSIASLSLYHSFKSHAEDKFVPVDVMMDQMKALGDWSYLDHLADMAGYKLVKKTKCNADVKRKAIELIAQAGTTVGQLATDLEDDELDKSEAARLRPILKTLRTLVSDMEDLSADIAGE